MNLLIMMLVVNKHSTMLLYILDNQSQVTPPLITSKTQGRIGKKRAQVLQGNYPTLCHNCLKNQLIMA